MNGDSAHLSHLETWGRELHYPNPSAAGTGYEDPNMAPRVLSWNSYHLHFKKARECIPGRGKTQQKINGKLQRLPIHPDTEHILLNGIAMLLFREAQSW